MNSRNHPRPGRAGCRRGEGGRFPTGLAGPGCYIIFGQHSSLYTPSWDEGVENEASAGSSDLPNSLLSSLSPAARVSKLEMS